MKHLLGRGAVGLGIVGAAIALSASAASAHVSIDTLGEVEQGSFAKLGFSVPNERDDAGTVSVRVQMPQDSPLVFVSVQPKAGWDIETTTRTLDEPVEMFGSSFSEVVDTITWTATGDTQIGPGQFELFWISAGAMPTDVDSLAFPAIQTYSSGEEVAWIDPPNADGSEPEHPAPTVALVAAADDGAGHDASAGTDSDDSDESDDSNTLALIALIVGAIGLVAGIGAIVLVQRSRS